MIFSRSSEYAIRAFVCLAESEPGAFVMAKDIAEKATLPGHFLAKILQQLARKGFLRSNKGPSGGFSLVQPASRISLMDIVSAVDGTAGFERCLVGHERCNEKGVCGMHNGWKQLRSRIVDYLEHTSIADLAGSNGSKRSRKRAS